MPFFQQSQRIIVNGGNFIENNVVPNEGEGIRFLLNSYVQSEAIHDSGARDSLGCHPGTREEYIRNITSWGTGMWNSEKRAFLMTGPAGAGKSAIASTCAHEIEEAGNLGASFFFFRPSGWNDPKKFIPTIVYQLTTRYSVYHDYINAVILRDRLVLEKAMDIQFRELLVKPLQRLSADGHSIGSDMVIIVDGLDECASVEAQIQIIHLITTSIHQHTTPFWWAFFSRPEPPIISAFSSEIAAHISWKLPLTLSKDAESDIEVYLHGSFDAIRAKRGIPTSVWPREDDVCRLVSQSAGLFIYAATAIRYIDGLDKGTSGLQERWRIVLQLDSESTENPFSALDRLYTLVMMQIPEGVLHDTMSLLLLDQYDLFSSIHIGEQLMAVNAYCLALDLSPAEFHVAISNLHSVLTVTKSYNGALDSFQFYHKSFIDFLLDPRRSKRYFLRTPGIHQHCLKKIVRTMATIVDIDPMKAYQAGCFIWKVCFKMTAEYDGQLEEGILHHLSQVDWNSWSSYYGNTYGGSLKKFIQKIPKDCRPKIIRPYRKGLSGIPRQILAMSMPERYRAEVYILGKGNKEVTISGKF